MFHYQKDIDAWRRHTRRLSPAEKGAYGELLDEMYSTEQPLPDDAEELYRIAGCSKPDERKAVDKVLSRFFELTDAGYVQARAFEEISGYHANAEKNRNNGKKGGRPPKNKNQNETQQKPTGLFMGSDSVSENDDFENPKKRQSGNPVIRESNQEQNLASAGAVTPNHAYAPPPPETIEPVEILGVRIGGVRSSPPQQTIPADWQPRPETVEALTSPLHAIPPQFVDEQVTEFRTFWRDRNTPTTSWDAKFIQRCSREWKLHGHSWKPHPEIPDASTNPKQPIDWSDSSWAEKPGFADELREAAQRAAERRSRW